jgi:transposase-like protein
MKKKQLSQSSIARRHGVTRQAVHKRLKAVDQDLGESVRMETADPQVKKAYLRERYLKMKAARKLAEIQLAQLAGTVVEVSRVHAMMDANLARAKAMFDARFRSEIPARCGGWPSDKLAQVMGDSLNEIFGLLEKGSEYETVKS